MSSDQLIEYGSKESMKGDEGLDDIMQKNQFMGPVKFTSKMEPKDLAENTIKAPSYDGIIKVENIPIPHSSFQPNATIKDQRRRSRIIDVSPIESILEENKNILQETIYQPQLDKPKESGKLGVNLFKIIMAKSHFNNFVANLLSKSYVKKPYHFSIFQNAIMDDLTYFDKRRDQKVNCFFRLWKNVKCFKVFDQSSIFVIAWQLLHIVTILITFFMTPYNVAFGMTYDTEIFENVTIANMEYFFLGSIVFDGIVVMNTTYIEKGIKLKSRRKILQNYLSSQAAYDLIAFASLLIALQLTVSEASEKLGWSMIPYTLFYLVRLLKLSVIVQKLEEYFNFTGSTQDFVELIKLLYTVVFIAHLFACLWHGVAFYNRGERTWLKDKDVEDADSFTRYNYSLYWAVQTMITVGYGDLSPQNNIERLCANCSMFLACGVFAFSFNSIGLMLSNLNSRQVLYRKSTNLLNLFLTKHQIQSDLQSRIRNYFDYIFQEEQEINDEEVQAITGKLSSNLQEELKFEIRMNVMKNSRVLTKFSQETLRQLSLLIEEVRFTPQDRIITQDQYDDCALYLISKGEVIIHFQDDTSERNIRILARMGKGSTFGEYSFFTGLNRTASVKSGGFTRAYKITRDNILSIIKNSQNDLEKFSEVKDKILLYSDYQGCNLECFSCHKQNHLIKYCPAIHYIPDKECILKKESYPVEQPRQSEFVRTRNDRNYFPALIEMKKIAMVIREFQTFHNDTVIDDGLDMIYDDDEPDHEMEQTSLSKSHSRISRQPSQNRSLSQEHTLQPIQESDDSNELVSPNQKQPRNKSVKQTLNTAGFGSGTEQFSLRFQQNISDPEIKESKIGTIHDPDRGNSRQDEHNFSLKPAESPNELRPGGKQQTILRQKRREESYKPISSKSILENKERSISIQRRARAKENSIEAPKSVISIDNRRVEQKRQTKTYRTRTARTAKSVKLDTGIQVSQDIFIPLQDYPPDSLELEEFENLKEFKYYFSWNNYDVIVKRTMRMLKLLLGKRKVVADFSLYTFSTYAMNMALRMRKKVKYIDEPTEQMKEKKINHSQVKHRNNNKRQTQEETILGLGLLRRNKGTASGTSVSLQFTLNSRFARKD